MFPEDYIFPKKYQRKPSPAELPQFFNQMEAANLYVPPTEPPPLYDSPRVANPPPMSYEPDFDAAIARNQDYQKRVRAYGAGVPLSAMDRVVETYEPQITPIGGESVDRYSYSLPPEENPIAAAMKGVQPQQPPAAPAVSNEEYWKAPIERPKAKESVPSSQGPVSTPPKSPSLQDFQDWKQPVPPQQQSDLTGLLPQQQQLTIPQQPPIQQQPIGAPTAGMAPLAEELPQMQAPGLDEINLPSPNLQQAGAFPAEASAVQQQRQQEFITGPDQVFSPEEGMKKIDSLSQQQPFVDLPAAVLLDPELLQNTVVGLLGGNKRDIFNFQAGFGKALFTLRYMESQIDPEGKLSPQQRYQKAAAKLIAENMKPNGEIRVPVDPNELNYIRTVIGQGIEAETQQGLFPQQPSSVKPISEYERLRGLFDEATGQAALEERSPLGLNMPPGTEPSVEAERFAASGQRDPNEIRLPPLPSPPGRFITPEEQLATAQKETLKSQARARTKQGGEEAGYFSRAAGEFLQKLSPVELDVLKAAPGKDPESALQAVLAPENVGEFVGEIAKLYLIGGMLKKLGGAAGEVGAQLQRLPAGTGFEETAAMMDKARRALGAVKAGETLTRAEKAFDVGATFAAAGAYSPPEEGGSRIDAAKRGAVSGLIGGYIAGGNPDYLRELEAFAGTGAVETVIEGIKAGKSAGDISEEVLKGIGTMAAFAASGRVGRLPKERLKAFGKRPELPAGGKSTAAKEPTKAEIRPSQAAVLPPSEMKGSQPDAAAPTILRQAYLYREMRDLQPAERNRLIDEIGARIGTKNEQPTDKSMYESAQRVNADLDKYSTSQALPSSDEYLSTLYDAYGYKPQFRSPDEGRRVDASAATGEAIPIQKPSAALAEPPKPPAFKPKLGEKKQGFVAKANIPEKPTIPIEGIKSQANMPASASKETAGRGFETPASAQLQMEQIKQGAVEAQRPVAAAETQKVAEAASKSAIPNREVTKQGKAYVAPDGTKFTGLRGKFMAEKYAREKSYEGAIVKSYGGNNVRVDEVTVDKFGGASYQVTDLATGQKRAHQTQITDAKVVEWPKAEEKAAEPTKQPWEMTKSEWRESEYQTMLSRTAGSAQSHYKTEYEKPENEGFFSTDNHKAEVQKALAAGKPIPPEVLADYPDLAPKTKPTTAESKPGLARDAEEADKFVYDIGSLRMGREEGINILEKLKAQGLIEYEKRPLSEIEQDIARKGGIPPEPYRVRIKKPEGSEAYYTLNWQQRQNTDNPNDGSWHSVAQRTKAPEAAKQPAAVKETPPIEPTKPYYKTYTNKELGAKTVRIMQEETPPKAEKPVVPAAKKAAEKPAEAAKTEAKSKTFSTETDLEGNIRAVFTLPSGEKITGRWEYKEHPVTGKKASVEGLREKSLDSIIKSQVKEATKYAKSADDVNKFRSEAIDKLHPLVVPEGRPAIIAEETIGGDKYDIAIRPHVIEDRVMYRVEMRRQGSSEPWESMLQGNKGTYDDAAKTYGEHNAGKGDKIDIKDPESLKAQQTVETERATKQAAEAEKKTADDKESNRVNAYFADLEAKASAIKGKKQTITRKLAGGRTAEGELPEVPATVYGELAIHKEGKNNYSITHVKTGLKAADADSIAEAKQIVYRYNNEGLDWNFTDPKKIPKVTSEKAPQIRREMKYRTVPESYQPKEETAVSVEKPAAAEAKPTEAIAAKSEEAKAELPSDPKSVLMRELHEEYARLADKSKWENDAKGRMPVGAGGFDAMIKAQTFETYLREMRNGKTPEEAEAATKALAREAVAKHNKQRPKDTTWQRWEGTEDARIENLTKRFKAVQEPPAEVKPTEQPAIEAKLEAPSVAYEKGKYETAIPEAYKNFALPEGEKASIEKMTDVSALETLREMSLDRLEKRASGEAKKEEMGFAGQDPTNVLHKAQMGQEYAKLDAINKRLNELYSKSAADAAKPEAPVEKPKTDYLTDADRKEIERANRHPLDIDEVKISTPEGMTLSVWKNFTTKKWRVNSRAYTDADTIEEAVRLYHEPPDKANLAYEKARFGELSSPIEKPTIPTLADNAKDLYREWEKATVSTPRERVVGLITGYGRFDWKDGKIWRLQEASKKGGMASRTEATRAELAEIDKAIKRGELQIQREPVTGVGQGEISPTARGEFKILHQARGRALPEEAISAKPEPKGFSEKARSLADKWDAEVQAHTEKSKTERRAGFTPEDIIISAKALGSKILRGTADIADYIKEIKSRFPKADQEDFDAIEKRTREMFDENGITEEVPRLKAEEAPSEAKSSASPELFPEPTEGAVMKPRQTIESARKSWDEELPEQLYEELTNKQSIKDSESLVDSNPDKALKLAMDTEASKKDAPLANAASIALIRRSQELARTAEAAGDNVAAEGHRQDARDLVSAMAERSTKYGQEIQFLKLIDRVSPEGVAMYAESQVQRAVRAVEKKQPGVKAAVEKKASAVVEALKTAKEEAASEAAAEVNRRSQGVVTRRTALEKARAARQEKYQARSEKWRAKSEEWAAREAEASKRLRIALTGARPEALGGQALTDLATVIVSKMFKHGYKSAALFNEMAAEYGEEIRPDLAKAYVKARSLFAKEGKALGMPQEEIADPAKIVASGISAKVGEPKTTEKDPLSAITKELIKKAGEKLPKGKSSPADYIARLREAAANREESASIMEEAKTVLREKYKDDPQSLAKLQPILDADLGDLVSKSSFEGAVKQSLKERGMKIGEIVRDSRKADETREKLMKRMQKDAGLSPEQAAETADLARGQFDAIVKEKQSKALRTLLKESPKGKKTRKTIADKILEIDALGGLSEAQKSGQIRTLVGKKLGLPGLDRAASTELENLSVEMHNAKTERERDILSGKMQKLIAEQVPASIGAKAQTALVISDLFNTATPIVNTFQDAIAYTTNLANEYATWAADASASAVGFKNRQYAGRPKVQFKAWLDGVQKEMQDAKLGISTFEGMTKRYDMPRSAAFRGPIGRTLIRAMSVMYGANQRGIYEAHYEESMRSQIEAAKVRGETKDKIDAKLPEMALRAKDEAMDKSFLGKNWATDALHSMSDFLEKLPVVGRPLAATEVTYKQIPGAILARQFEYLPPVALARAGKDIYKAIQFRATEGAKGVEFDRRAFMPKLGKIMLGSGIAMPLSMGLRAMGVIIAPNDDKRGGRAAKLLREEGITGYQLNVSGLGRYVASLGSPQMAEYADGDELIDLDVLQPLGFTASFAANLWDNWNGNKRESSAVEKLLDLPANVMESAGRTFTDNRIFQNLSDLFSGKDRTLMETAGKLLQGIPERLVPSLIKQVRKMRDEGRETDLSYKDESRSFAEVVGKNTVSRVANALPYASERLPAKYGTYGERRPAKAGIGEGARKVFSVFVFNRASQFNEDPIGKYAMEIFRARKDKEDRDPDSHIPGFKEPIQIDGKDRYLSPQEKSDMKKYIGENGKAFTDMAMNSDWLRKLKPEEQGKAIGAGIKAIAARAKVEVLGDRSEGYSAALKFEMPKSQETFDHNMRIEHEQEEAVEVLKNDPLFKALGDKPQGDDKKLRIEARLRRMFDKFKAKEEGKTKEDIKTQRVNLGRFLSANSRSAIVNRALTKPLKDALSLEDE